MDVFDDCLALLTDNQLKFLEKLEVICKDEEINDVKSTNQECQKTYLSNLPDNLIGLEDYFDKSESILDEEKEIKLQKLNEYSKECNQLMTLINEILKQLEHLKAEYDSAFNKTNDVHLSCKNVTNQHQSLISSVQEIEMKLSYFKEYKVLEKKFYAPSTALINENLVPSLTRLDDCIDFFAKNPNYLESEKYLNQFRYLQNQALIIIKNFIVNTICQNSKKILPQSSEDLSQGENVFTLFYGKFQTFAPKIKSLVDILERREHLDESYETYLSECHQAFFNSRDILISTVLRLTIEEMINSNKNSTCSLVRQSSKTVLHICCNERQLFYDFFNKHSKLLEEFIEKLTLILYDILRPKVIKLNHLESLAELCHILRIEILEDESLIKFKELQSFSKIIDQLMQDVQERLIYRTNIYIQTDIVGYDPVPGDLAYPEKLELLNNQVDRNSFSNSFNNSSGNLSRSGSIASIASTTFSTNTLSEVALISNEINQFSSNAESLHYHLWYPTVRRTIMCLTKLFRSLEHGIFQELAQEVISCCIESLDMAARKIAQNKSRIDCYLFMIKHLLIIRDQIAPFKIECTVREAQIDFQRVKDAALNLLNRSDTIFSLSTNNGLLNFLFEVQSTPQVIDHILDSQRIVDNKIKNLCELFINYSVHLVLRRLQSVRIQLVNCSKLINNERDFIKNEEKGTRLENVESNVANTELIVAEECVETQIETIDSCEHVEKSNDHYEVNAAPNGQQNMTSSEHQTNLQQNFANDQQSSLIVEQSATNQHITNQSSNEQSEDLSNGRTVNSALNNVQQLMEDLNELISEANEQVIVVQKSMKLYLSSEDTEAILFKPIKNQIVKSIEILFSQLAHVFSDQEQKLYNECQFKTAKSALESIFNTNRRNLK